MHTGSEIIALPKFCSPAFVWGHRALFTEVIGNFSIQGQASLGWVKLQLGMEQAVQEGDKAAGSEPTLHSQHTQEGCWGNMEHFTYSIMFPSLPSLHLSYWSHLRTKAGGSSFAWWQVSVALSPWSWTGQPIHLNQWNNSQKHCHPEWVWPTSNPSCRGFLLKDSVCGASSPPPVLLCHCLLILLRSGKPKMSIRHKQKCQRRKGCHKLSRPVWLLCDVTAFTKAGLVLAIGSLRSKY